MSCVASIRRTTPATAGRHISAVPQHGQQGLWDSTELDRLAHLRQLATGSGAPDEVLRLIDSAATADEALDLLTEAGLMPSDEESAEGVLSFFTPLLEPDCDRLTAELVWADFLSMIRRDAPADADIAALLLALIGHVQGRRIAETLAMMRVLAAVGPAEVQPTATAVAGELAAAGLAEPRWAAELGAPKPGPCFGYEDIFGEQRSLVMTFSYGRKKHALVVLIDYVLGGGIKDCFFTDGVAGLRNEYLALSRDPEVVFSDLDGAQARAIVDEALSRDPCPVEPDQAESVEKLLDLVQARVALLPAAAKKPGAARKPTGTKKPADAKRPAEAKRPAGPKNIHRIKVTLRGSKPPIWRRLEVPSDITLLRLHDVIQLSFGWLNHHRWVFETEAGNYGISDPELGFRSAANKKLSAVADWPGDRLRYEYDFGDSWEHDIVVEAVQPADPGGLYPRCTAGRRACPPDDSGGISEYYVLLETLANPRSDDHEAMLQWLGITSPTEFDPEYFSLDEVNNELSPITKVLVRL
jgi:hypothetical protein